MPKSYAAGDQLPASEYNAAIKVSGTYGTSSSGNDTYAITVTPVPTTYADGDEYTLKPDTANTGPATLNVNSLGAKTIKRFGGAGKVDLMTGDIQVNQPIRVKYDGTDFILNPVSQLINVDVVNATALDNSLTTITTITHGLGCIPRIIRITALRINGGGNNTNSMSMGIAVINNVTGAIISQNVSVMSDGGSGFSGAGQSNKIAGITGGTGPGTVEYGTLLNVGATTFDISFAGVGFGTITPGGAFTYQFEVIA